MKIGSNRSIKEPVVFWFIIHTMIAIRFKLFSETNGRKVSVDKNGREVDPILAFAKTQHFYAEGPDFLLSDLILYPLYSLIMNRFSKVILIQL